MPTIPSSCHDQVTTGNGVPPPKFKSYWSHAVTVDTATSHPPGDKTLGPNSSSLHTLCRDDYSKSTISESPVTIKWEVRLTSSSPKSNYLTFLSSMTLPTHMTYQLVIVISVHYQCAPFFPQSLQLPPLLIS